MAEELNRYLLASASTRRIEKTAKLWRYLTFEKFAWLFEKSKLYHARLDFLGDPFEGSLTAAYVRKRDSGEKVRRLQSDEISIEHERAIHKASVYSRFVTCWHESPYESAAMWKLYSTESAGVAIVSTPARMYDAVDLSQYKDGVLSPVQYLDFEKDGMTLPNSMGRFAMPGLLKRKSFQHENEVRGLIIFEDYAKMQLPNPHTLDEYLKRLQEKNPIGISVNVELDRLIEEIYISPLAKSHFREVIEIMAKRHGLNDRIRPSTLLGKPVW